MPKVENSKVQISFKINKELLKALETKCRAEQITKTEMCAIALEKELYKDVNLYNELLGTSQEIIRIQNRIEKKFDIYSSMFVYFLKYFFTAHMAELNKENVGSLNAAFAIGEEKKEKFLKNFKLENKQMTNIIESLLADYIAQEV